MLNIIVKQRQRQIEIHQDPCSIKRERGKDLCGDAKGATLPPGSLPIPFSLPLSSVTSPQALNITHQAVHLRLTQSKHWHPGLASILFSKLGSNSPTLLISFIRETLPKAFQSTRVDSGFKHQLKFMCLLELLSVLQNQLALCPIILQVVMGLA